MPKCRRESGFRLESIQSAQDWPKVQPRSPRLSGLHFIVRVLVLLQHSGSLTLLECLATLAVRALFAQLFPPG